MKWIIWTCGWWLVVGVVNYLDAKEFTLRSWNSSKNARGLEALVLLVVWIIGMVKFW